jgi:heterodisulfide reductase subunit D
LGRKGGVYDAPRGILKSIPGLTLVELENKRGQSLCCGGGGNLEMVDSELTETLAQKKIEEIERTGAKTVVTSCQQCVRTIASRARRQEVDLNVWDITELVLKTMSK